MTCVCVVLLWKGSIFWFLLFWSETSSSFLLTHWIPRLEKLLRNIFVSTMIWDDQKYMFRAGKEEIYFLKDCMTWDKRDVQYVHLWRRLFWGFIVTTQIPEPFGQSLPTRQWGWGRCGRSLVTKETVTVTFFMWSMGPWIWKRENRTWGLKRSLLDISTWITISRIFKPPVSEVPISSGGVKDQEKANMPKMKP